jgi:hypothetical protein
MARIRSKWACTTSTDDAAPDLIAAAVSIADHCQIGPLGRRVAADLRGVDRVAVLATFFIDFFAARFVGFLLINVFLATSRLPRLLQG